MTRPATKTSISRSAAWELLQEFTQQPHLIKHALAVEAAMRYYARHFSEDENVWGIVGLLHDFDYERYPSLEHHPYQGQRILEERGYPLLIRQGIMAHAPHTGTLRQTLMEKAIFAVDELTGFIVAVALVKPNKQLAEVSVSSVTKKLKQKGFAANVKREDISTGAEELGLSLEQHIEHVLTALQGVAPELGL